MSESGCPVNFQEWFDDEEFLIDIELYKIHCGFLQEHEGLRFLEIGAEAAWDQQQSKIERLTKCVEFYADEKNWQDFIAGDNLFDFVEGDICDAFSPDYENNKQDSGDRARQTLRDLK